MRTLPHLTITAIAGLLTLPAPTTAQSAIPETCIAGDCVSGVGIAVTFGLRYEGEWQEGKPHGIGRRIKWWGEEAAIPTGDLEYGTFEEGMLTDGCALFLGPYEDIMGHGGEAPKCTEDLNSALRGYHSLLEAQGLLSEFTRATLRLPFAAAELNVGEDLLHSGIDGADHSMLERAQVHLRLAVMKAQRLGTAAQGLESRAADALQSIQDEMAKTREPHEQRVR